MWKFSKRWNRSEPIALLPFLERKTLLSRTAKTEKKNKLKGMSHSLLHKVLYLVTLYSTTPSQFICTS